MIAPDVRIVDLDMDQLAHLTGLLVAALEWPPRAQEGRRGLFLLLVEGGEVVKAYHSVRGPLEGFDDLGPRALSEMAHRAGAAQILRIERGAIERFFERFQREVDFEGDFLAQLFAAVRAIQPEIGTTLRGWPEDLGALRWLYETPTRLLTRRVPTSGPLVTVVFDLEREEVFTSSIARLERRGRETELILWTSTDRLLADGPPICDLESGQQLVSERIAAEYGEPAVGLYLTRPAAERLVGARRPATELAALEQEGAAQLSPWPLPLRVLLLLARLIGF